ncbi:MAG: helix-turn-helix domain-containing protein [Oscillospiraceae bacterium]|nr:helix-turn-helix domain-containing protein [Oscillospiraceae bacterium]
MNQEKIGKFIAECRREQNLTQAQLAEQLGITNRAVSKWENAKSMPDVSIMVPLCEILNISVNELLSGEKISMDDYKETAEQNLIDIREKKQRADKAMKRISIIWLLLSLIITPIHFAINYCYPDNHGTGMGTLYITICIALYLVTFFKYYEVKLK